MSINITKKEIIKWTEVFFSPDRDSDSSILDNWTYYKEIFCDRIAESLYEDIRRARMLITSPFTFNNEFSKLTNDEKSVWYEYALGIPGKLKSLNLFIRPFKDFCRTCIITASEIEKLAQSDNIHYQNKQGSFDNIPDARKWYFKELNYLIPPQLKKIGYEIIRPDEVSDIDSIMIKKISRALHSRYLQAMRNQNAEAELGPNSILTDYGRNTDNKNITDFDSLPEDIQYSNKDNAYHIPTKLLSIGYKIRPIQKGFKSITLHLDDDEIETMANVEHIRWSWDKRLNGWIYGNLKDISNKIHPGLIPYDQLSESEKEKDRELVRLIPALLQDIDFEAYPVNPGHIKNLSYAIKPQSSIHKLLIETRELNNEIRNLASASPVIEEKVRTINKKIEETINEVQGSYTYARNIQEAFLPDDLFVRECFPDSFILFKPKDVVSGDFYFFSKQNDLITFAAADCTGHGIPGSLISTIGYGITDQAVNEIRLTDPAEILNHLYSRVHRFLRVNEEGTHLSDDMDIVLCSLDIGTNVLTYSGVKNPLYHVTNGELIVYRAKNPIDPSIENGECQYISEKVQLKAGDTIYLCSDGYTDQFGGMYHKKYQSNRFKSLLISIQKYSMPEQSDKLYEEIEQWREENNEDQTDDILVIGIRI